MLDANIAFSLEKPTALIHKREAAQTLWAGCLKSDEALEGLCLISGDNAPIARLHPAIKGVFGGQSSGGSIISFNKEAFVSFGKEQGANAPVSEQSAFAYTTVLNYLLRRENNHCLTIGDASTSFGRKLMITPRRRLPKAFSRKYSRRRMTNKKAPKFSMCWNKWAKVARCKKLRPNSLPILVFTS